MSEEDWKQALTVSFEKCQWKSVLFYCDRLLKIDPSNFTTLFCRAFAFYCTQQYAELEQWMSDLPVKIQQNEQLLVIRCKGLQATKNYSKIISILGGYTDTISLIIPVLTLEELKKSPKLLMPIRENALFNLSHTDYYPNQKDKSKNPEKSESNDPLNPNRIVKLITTAMMTQDPELLMPFSLMTDKTTENDALILTACGCCSLLNDQAEAGEAFLIKATEEDPDCEIAWLCLISSFTSAAEWDQGLSTLRKVIRRFPTSTSVSMFAMSLHLKSGSVSLAWPWIHQLTENRILNDTRNLSKTSKTNETKKENEKVNSSNILNSNAFSIDDKLFVIHERGVALLMDGDVAQATHDFKAVIEQSKDRNLIGAASLNLGHCYRKLGDFTNAINFYQEALSYGSKPAEALASIGFTYHLKGDKDDAILYYNRCLSIDAVHPFATKMLDIAVQQQI